MSILFVYFGRFCILKDLLLKCINEYLLGIYRCVPYLKVASGVFNIVYLSICVCVFVCVP